MGYQRTLDEVGQPQLWLAGGVYNDNLTAASSFFDVADNGWAAGPDLATTAVYRTALAKVEDELYLLGGSTGSFSYTGLADHLVQCTPPVVRAYVRDIRLSYRYGIQYGITAAVMIRDIYRDPVPAATVTGIWTLPDGSTQDKTTITNPNGVATFRVKSPQTGDYTFCFTGLTKLGYLYDPDLNYETCDTITVP